MKALLATAAALGFALAAPGASAKEKLDMAVVGGLSDITQFHGQFFLGVRDVLETYEGADVTVTTYSPAGGLEDEIGMDTILRNMETLAPDDVVFIVVHWNTVQDRLVALQKAGVNLMVVEFAPENAGEVKPFAGRWGLRIIGMLDKVGVVGIGGQLEELAAICRREIPTAGVRDPRGQGQIAARAIIGHYEGKPFEVMNFAPQVAVSNCDEVFAFHPVEMLNNAGFRNNIAPDQWKPRQ